MDQPDGKFMGVRNEGRQMAALIAPAYASNSKLQ